MRKHAVLAAAAGMALAGVAKADFTLTVTQRDLGNGTTASLLWALNNGGSTGTRVLGVDITLIDCSHDLVVKFKSTAANAPADMFGTTQTDPYNPNASFVNVLGDASGGPSGVDNDPTAFLSPTGAQIPSPAHGNFHDQGGGIGGISQFEVSGFNGNGGVVADSTTNGGKGALIAALVAPTGDMVAFLGSVGGDAGTAQAIDFDLRPCPEPANLSVLSIGVGALVARRRRA